MTHTVRELAAWLGVPFLGEGDTEITGVAGLREAAPGDLSFLSDARYAALMTSCRAAAVIVPESFEGTFHGALLRSPDPSEAFQRVVDKLAPPPAPHPEGIHPSAVIAPDAVLGNGVGVGAHVVIEAGARVGPRTRLWAGCYLGANTQVGEDCILYPHVCIREYCQIGHRVILHNGVVVGGDGFGYTVDARGVRTKVPQRGSVVIGDDTEIGCNSTVDRARFGVTRIGRGVKIDNLVHVAHNVAIGDHAVLVAQVGISGSTVIGDHVILGGQAGVAGHLAIGPHTLVSARAGVTKDIAPHSHVSGFPASPHLHEARRVAHVNRLPHLKKHVALLEQRLESLERICQNLPLRPI